MKKLAKHLAKICLAILITGCAATSWRVKTDADFTDESQNIISVNNKYLNKLTDLSASLSKKTIYPGVINNVRYNYVGFEEYKSDPVLSVYVSLLFTTYNSNKTSKVSRCVSAFSDTIHPVLQSVKECGLINNDVSYKSMKLTSAYSVRNFSSDWDFGKQEVVNYIIPVDLAKKYLNQDLSVQELLEKSIVLIDGQRNSIKVNDSSID